MEIMMKKYVQEAVELRKRLHEVPEKSMQEKKTKEILMDYVKIETKLEVIDCGNWFYVAWRGDVGEEMTSLAFRADYDAVTGTDGVSRHLCGHDGHAAILASFGKMISDLESKRNIFLLFQPGEESGEGAKVCLDLFRREKVDEIYGFHNIPGYPSGKLLLRKGTFACASTGLEIRFMGAPSHAAYPESGRNPGVVVAEMILEIAEYVKRPHRGMLLSTVIGIDLGSQSFGVSASEGTLRLTVRAEYHEKFEAFLAYIWELLLKKSATYDLKVDMKEIEKFPATENHLSIINKLEHLAQEKDISYEMLSEPFRWSEDFGWYLQEKTGAIFGIGAGENCPQLHTEHYEFPDEIISEVIKIYYEICTASCYKDPVL